MTKERACPVTDGRLRVRREVLVVAGFKAPIAEKGQELRNVQNEQKMML